MQILTSNVLNIHIHSHLPHFIVRFFQAIKRDWSKRKRRLSIAAQTCNFLPKKGGFWNRSWLMAAWLEQSLPVLYHVLALFQGTVYCHWIFHVDVAGADYIWQNRPHGAIPRCLEVLEMRKLISVLAWRSIFCIPYLSSLLYWPVRSMQIRMLCSCLNSQKDQDTPRLSNNIP